MAGSEDPALHWNGLLLLSVTVVPFPTAMLARYLPESAHEARIAAAVYSGMGVASALAYLAAFALSFVSSWASVGVCLALALVFALRGLWGKR